MGLLLTAPIVLLGLPIWGIAVLTRALVPLFQRTVVPWEGLIEFHPKLGWKPKPNFDGYCLEQRDDVFHVVTGPDGWPGRSSLSESPVVVFGDSFAFGYGIDARKSFLELVPEVPIKAIAAPGYNLVQEVLLMEELSSELEGKLVVWLVCLANDLYDNLSPEMSGYRTPFVRWSETHTRWEIVAHHVNPSPWSCSAGRQGVLRFRFDQGFGASGFLSDRAYSACGFLISQGRDITRRAGADLVVATIPTPRQLECDQASASEEGTGGFDPEYPDEQIGAICERLQVRFVPLKPYLNRADYKRRDEHWNEKGHQKVAEVLAALHRDHVQRAGNDEPRRDFALGATLGSVR